VSKHAWDAHGFSGDAASLLSESTLVHAWLLRWASAPTSLALRDAQENWCSNQQLATRCELAAAHLVDRGIQPGDHVLMSCVPSVEMVILHIAVLMVGAVVVPVNTGFTAAEVCNIATEADVKMIIVSDQTRVLPDVAASGVTTLSEHDEVFARTAAQHQLEQLRTRSIALRSHDPAMLLFTSGTTGKPKGALLSHGNLLASAAALVASWQWAPSDRLVLCLPLFHMHGLGVGVHGTLLAGASAVILPGFSEDAVFDTIETQQATMLFGVPTMWTRLLRSSRVAELAPLRLCVSGSAPLSAEAWNGLVERSGQQILERYGMTETVMLTSNPLHGIRKPGSVGLPLPGVDVMVHQPGTDAVGELIVRGPNVFSGYVNRPDANAEAFIDGWFRTGDLGRVDPDGYVTIVGRCKDLIITGGYNVYPSDVEAVLATHPDVTEVAVIGEPSDLWGETVTACVVLASGATTTESELITFAAAHLADYQRPRRIVSCIQLPRNALGKVVKAELAQQVRMEP
jgi:malonyl-CoA/methylmalonyl-CoA synthetase